MGGRSAKLGNRRSGAGGKVALDLTPAMRTKVQALCADDNATFARRHGLPLDRYGYLLPGYDTSTHSASESSQTVLSQR